jgi:molybdopterin molybdotransferase
MLAATDAIARILARVRRLGAETVPLDEAYGRILAEDLVARVDVPPWDNAAVDGYAVRSGDLVGDATLLRVNETVTAGRVASMPVLPGTATAVMTGAPIPDGADAMVMVEDTDGGTSIVRVSGRARPGQHVRRRGEDTSAGARILDMGTRLSAAKVGYAAAVGVAAVPVVRRPVVGLLATGDELVPPGRPLGPGQIYASNSATLAGLVRDLGGVPVDLGVAADDLGSLIAAFDLASRRGLDVLVTTGGVSVGTHDFVKDALAAVGGELAFWKVAMKPGKPLAFGWMGDMPIFGLPGNPVSCGVNFHEFVAPYLRTAMGSSRVFLPIVDATAAEDIAEKPGRLSLVRVILEEGPDGWTCRAAGSQSSGVLGAFARAHGLLLLAPESTGLRAGDRGRVQVLDWSFLDRADAGLP